MVYGEAAPAWRWTGHPSRDPRSVRAASQVPWRPPERQDGSKTLRESERQGYSAGRNGPECPTASPAFLGICRANPPAEGGVIYRLRFVTRVLAAAAAVGLAGLLSGCSGSTPGTSKEQRPIRIASYDFVENQILAELYGQALRRAGFEVQMELGLGTREIVEPALEQGQVDFVVDYLGTALDFLLPGSELSHGSAESVHEALRKQFSSRGIAVLPFASATDQNGFVVTSAFSRDRRVAQLSDLAPLARTLVLGGPPECPTRRYCLVGLKTVYGLSFKAFRPISTRAATATALAIGEIDVGMLETTDPRLAGGRLQLLRDDRSLQPRENVVPLVRQDILRAHDDFEDTVAVVTDALTTEELIKLNHAVDVQRQSPAAAAAAWLQQHPART
jgi:osmoprotectant transport system substrate-binding protein